MKIMFTLTPAFNPNAGGVQRTTYKLGRFFTEQGLDVSYYSLANAGHVPVEYGQLFTAPASGSNQNPVNIQDLERVLQQVKPQIVINQMPYERELTQALADHKTVVGYTLLGCLRNSLFSVKNNIIQTAEQLFPARLIPFLNHQLGRWILLQLHRFKHRRSLQFILDRHDKFILLAPPNREELAYFVGDYQADKVLSIPNSIPGVATKNLHKEKIILHVGRLNIPQKRSDLLLDFWEKACPELPEWRFVIVGDGPFYGTMVSEIKKRGLPRLQLVGYQRPEPYYEQAAVFIMSSAYEGFPNVLLEAQSFGAVPLAFANYAALLWIVNDGKDAVLSQPFDTTQMAHQVIQLIGDSGRLAQMQQAAKENAAKFTIEKVGQMWLKLFQAL